MYFIDFCFFGMLNIYIQLYGCAFSDLPLLREVAKPKVLTEGEFYQKLLLKALSHHHFVVPRLVRSVLSRL